MAKLNKEQIDNILNSIHPKESNDPVDKYTELLRTVSGNQQTGIDPMLMMLMSSNNNGSKSMDKIYEMIAMKSAMKMLGDDDDKPKHNEITELIKALQADTDKKLMAMQENVTKQIEMLKELMPKPKSDESILLEKLVERMDNANKKGDTDEVDRLIKLIGVMQANKPSEKDPIETFGKMYEMFNAPNEKYFGLREELMQQQNEATQKQLDNALEIIKEHGDNSDWMQELRKSTATINQFKSFMEESGLKPAPSKDSGGKVDLKYILDTVSEVVKNVAPNIPPPRQNPSWDVDKEAVKLYNRYKDILGDENGKPLTVDFVKRELARNPNVENIWKQQIKEAYEKENLGNEGNPDIGEPTDSDDEIAKLFEEIDKKNDKKDNKDDDDDTSAPVIDNHDSDDDDKPDAKKAIDKLPPIKKMKGVSS